MDWVLFFVGFVTVLGGFVLLAGGGGESSMRDGRFPALLRGLRSRAILLKISEFRVLVSREGRGGDRVDVWLLKSVTLMMDG
jgi:hypothetical protein